MGIKQTIDNTRISTLAYALWLTEESDSSETPQVCLRDLSLSWLRFGYQGPVIESNSINTILSQAIENEYQWCFIQTPGNIISEDWMLPHWQKADFHTSLKQLTSKEDFLVSANIIATDDYFSLDCSCFLVNLSHYKNMGYPDFGFAQQTKTTLYKPQVFTQPSSIASRQITRLQPLKDYDENSINQSAITEEFHRVKSQTQVAQSGWGFIDASLRHGLAIQQLPENIYTKQLSLTSKLNSTPVSELTNQTANPDKNDTNYLQQNFLSGVANQISRGRHGVFLWNIESYADLPVTTDLTIEKKINTLSNLYCVAAGFKPNMLLSRHGFSADTRVVFFDYSQQALTIRKVLINEWDGFDYPDFCRYLIQRFSSEETFYQLWNGLKPEQIDWDDVTILWKNELLNWGGEYKFQQQWKAQQRLNYQFVHCDLVNNPSPLLEKINEQENSAIWWSNAFFTISSNWLLSIEQRKQLFSHWINQLAQKAPDCMIYGADHNNAPLNNITAAQYLNQLNERKKSNLIDELTPNNQTSRPLRF